MIRLRQNKGGKACLTVLLGCLLGVGLPVQASEIIEEVLVIGSKASRQTIAGSATILSQEDLGDAGLTDLNQILLKVPGLYVREEDGFGLRPNVGIRGATSERSQKITLMEDGILITPAPYAAPAAYYIPTAAKIVGIEVLKGPSAINHGPHTVGGAINFLSRSADLSKPLLVDIELGRYGRHKVLAAASGKIDQTTVLGQVLSYGSEGFKSVDGGGETGFSRQDFDLKLVHVWPGSWGHRSILKMGIANETSDETYLGLSDTDFDESPYRRYVSSRGDQFNSKHSKIQLIHTMAPSDGFRISAKAYRHRFDRSWFKVDGFLSGPSLTQVLNDPEDYVPHYLTLTGAQDSVTTGLSIDKTDNARVYRAQGISVDTEKVWSFEGGGQYVVKLGIRRHIDGVRRKHQPFGFNMTGGALVSDGVAYDLKVNNDVEAKATAFVISNQIDWRAWNIDFGVRHERIDSEVIDFSKLEQRQTVQREMMPGLGVSRFFGDRFVVFSGVYEGFSPASAAARTPVPERSVNFEYGLRYFDDSLEVDVVGFFSDYENLVGRCRASDADCEVGSEFSGGQVEIGGVELSASKIGLATGVGRFDFRLNYTYTESAFQSEFLSSFSQWGLVRKGDALPYLPSHVGSGSVTLTRDQLQYRADIGYQDYMRERPGSSVALPGERTERRVTLALSVLYKVNQEVQVQLFIKNATDEQAIVSRRPFGARPNAPRYVGIRLRFGDA